MTPRTGKPSEVYQRVIVNGEALVTVIPEGADPNYWAKILKNYDPNKKRSTHRGKTRKERGAYNRKTRNYAEQVLDRRNAEW